MPKIVRLTESDLNRIVRRIIKEDVSLGEENYNLHQAVKFIARGTADCHKKSATGINCDNIIMDSITSNSDEEGDEISFKIKFSSDSFEIPFHSELEGLTENPQEFIDEVKDRIENRVIVGDENVNNGIQGRTFRKTTVEYVGEVNGAHTFLVKQTSGRVSREEKLSESDLTRLVRRMINEFDYEPHKNKNIEIIDRFVITINPGSDDVIEMEGVLARHKNDNLIFKQLKEVKIFSSSNSRELIKDEEISLGQADRNGQNSAEFFNSVVGQWLYIVSEGDQFRYEIPVGENINVSGMGANFIGDLRGIFMNIKFETI